MTPEQAAQLRAPFPATAIGKLPKPTRKDAQKGNCRECGGYHGLPAVHLDYVGHAATTDRLLAVDPAWTWEPLGTDDRGLPAPDAQGNLWIKLTICGVTRIGVGDGSSMKERIGDAIRNAAMRFGVALDLWSKEELEQSNGAVGALEKAPPPQLNDQPGEDGEAITPAQVRKLNILLREAGHETDEDRYRWLSAGCQRQITSSKQLTKSEAMRAIDALERAKATDV